MADLITRPPTDLEPIPTPSVAERLLTTQAPQRPHSVGIVGTLPEAEDEDEVPAGPPAAFNGLATPMVRRMARERGIDLSGIRLVFLHGPPEEEQRERRIRSEICEHQECRRSA